jgi:BirA family biotin operon repressor/biotin-[acetyl-CoA-carboxylase] ligase
VSAAGALAAGAIAWRLEAHGELPSTSDVCRARAEAGEPAGLAVLARRQVAGRGRDGRAWESPVGNLSLSVLLRPRLALGEAGAWSLLSGVALAGALAAHLPPAAPIALKWPNDVLLGGAKLAGILIECAADMAGGLEWLVVGMGANLAVAPRVADRLTACLAEYGPPPAPEAFASELLALLGHWAAVREAEGLAPIRDAWLARGPAMGAPVAFRYGTERIEGTFAGLGEQGSLRLVTAQGVRNFAAGEVIG